jgi:hypothetical protein
MGKDYKVGYGKPPEGSRFKKGQSGNPRGKQKGVRSLDAELSDELRETVRVSENGRRKTYSKRRLIIKSLVARAIKGDVRAAMAAIKLQLDHPEQDDRRTSDLSDTDRTILEDFLRRHGEEREDRR